MNKDEIDFDSWFDIVVVAVSEQAGVQFKDRESVRDNYENGDDAFDVAADIAQEYNE